MTVLLLNASYEPLAVVSWKRAVTLVVTGRAETVEQNGSRVIRSAGGIEFPLPGVVRLMQMVSFASMRANRSPNYSRAGLAARDNGECQVSGCDARGTTVDHVVPRSRGGDNSWTNCVLMCLNHNSRKGDRSLDELGWTLKQRPVAPHGLMIGLRATRGSEWTQWVHA